MASPTWAHKWAKAVSRLKQWNCEPARASRGGLEKCTRLGYSLEVKMMRALKRKDFARWKASEKLPDASLCKAVQEMERGLIAEDLGGFRSKKRVATPGRGTRNGYRQRLSPRLGGPHCYCLGI